MFKYIFSKTTQNTKSSNNYTTFVSISYVQGVSEPIKRVLAQVGIEVALKPYFTLSSVFRQPKNGICDEKKCGFGNEIPCRDCDAVYVGETGRSLNTRKKGTREDCERDELTKVRFMSTYCNL